MGQTIIGADGTQYQVIGGALVPMHQIVRAGTIQLPEKPPWRMPEVIPGVNAPSIGKQYIPLVPSVNGGVFTAAVTAIEFAARPQRPFRPERLLVSVLRTGATSTGRILASGIFVGASLQSAQRGEFDVELIGSGNFFDTSLALQAASTSMDVALPCRISLTPTAPDTVFVTMMWLGQVIAS